MLKYLEGQGDRVQYSVFEVYWRPGKERDAALRRLRKMIKVSEDRLRIYAIPGPAVSDIMVMGEGKVYEVEDVVIL